jgi:hypothetical protein
MTAPAEKPDPATEEFAGPEPARPGGRRKFFAAILAVAVISALGILLVPQILVDRLPADFKIDGSNLVVVNKKGRPIWRFETGLENLLPEREFRDRFLKKSGLTSFLISDLDYDGRLEVLFAPQTGDGRGAGRLFVFEAKGRERWVFETGREIRSGDGTIPADFGIRGFVVHDFEKDLRSEIVLVSQAVGRSPGRLLLLDLNKKILGDFLNDGPIEDLLFTDLTRDEHEEIVVVGRNDEFMRPCLFIFDGRDVKGGSPQGPGRAFPVLDPGSEKIYILFPRTALDELKKSDGSLREVQLLSNERIRAITDLSDVFYEFDFTGRLLSVDLGNSYERQYGDFFRKGRLTDAFDSDRIRRQLAAGLHYFDGSSKAWMPRPALVNSW